MTHLLIIFKLRICISKIGNRISFRIKGPYYFELWNYLETKSKITKDKSSETIRHLEINKVVLIHYNVVNNDYQHDSRLLNTFVSNKSFGQLWDASPKNFIILETFNLELSYIEVWFTDQNSKPLEIENIINITLVIKQNITYKNDFLFELSEVSLYSSTKRSNNCKRFFVVVKNMSKNIGKNISENLSAEHIHILIDHLNNLLQMNLKLVQQEQFKNQLN